MRVEKRNRTINLYLDEKRILSDISFRIGWKKGIGPRDCKFVGKKEEKSEDGIGSFKDIIFRYEYLGAEIRLMFRVYKNAVYIGMENELSEGGFSHLTGEISIGRIPAVRRGMCCRNSWEGLKKMPKTFSEFRFMMGFLAEYLSFWFKKPYAFDKYVLSHLLKDSGYACWTYPKFFKTLREIPPHTLFLVLDAKRPLVFLPMSAYGQKSSLAYERGRLRAKMWGFDVTKVYRRMPGIVVAAGEPLFAAPLAFKILREVSGKKILLREDKGGAKVFEKLGWCSFNAFYRRVRSEGIVETIRGMREKQIPIKFVIIDDGWQSTKSKMLTSFNLNEKFEMKKIIRELKEKLGVERVGLWHALQGYWMGIHPKSEIAKLAFKGSDGRLIPLGKEFFERWHEKMAEWGVDFVKVDNQFDLLPSVVNRIPIEGAASKALSNMHEAAEGKLETILNCMEVVPECYYNDKTPTHRCSADYPPGSKDGTKKHLISCAYNSFWISNLGIPDYDTFQTHDRFAKPHAIARAMSGGPIYFTDEPNKSDEKIARRLCLDGGEMPKLDFPALVSSDSLFEDPYTTTKPLKLFTKLGEIGLVAVFNLNKAGAMEKTIIRSQDAILPKGEYAIYRVCKGEIAKNEMPVNLGELESDVFVISPIKNGFAPIGIGEMFIPPGAIKISRSPPFACEVGKDGTFIGYSERGVRVKVNGKIAKFEIRNRCLRLPVRKNDTITIR